MKSVLLKTVVFFLLFFGVLSCVGGPAFADDLASAANIYLFPQPYKMADLVLSNSSGKAVSLGDYRGKVVLLHFWSIRCPACRMEEPLLESMKRVFGKQGLEILGVNLVDPPSAVVNYAMRKRTPFPVLYDGGRGFNLKTVNMGGRRTSFLVNPGREAILEVPGFPTTYIIDCKGQAVGYSVGAARWNHGSAVALIRNLISQSRSCGIGSSRRYSKLNGIGGVLF